MNKKLFKISKSLVVTIIVIILMPSGVFSQGLNWKLDGNINVTPHSFIGSLNYADFQIKTHNKTRAIYTKEGTVLFLYDVNVKGKLITNSIKINGYAEVDSMRVKGALHIGDSSLVLGGSPYGTSDNIQSTNGVIKFGKSTGNITDIKISVGLPNTINPVQKFQLHDNGYLDQLRSVKMSFTNYAAGYLYPLGTGTTVNDGFQIGIDATGNAELNQGRK